MLKLVHKKHMSRSKNGPKMVIYYSLSEIIKMVLIRPTFQHQLVNMARIKIKKIIFKLNPSAKSGAGFTLIELLVVIAIIGLLASIVLVALNGARTKARDTKRIADIRQLQTALELYYNDNNSQYPNVSCESTAGGAWSACWSSVLPSTYVSKMPVDPTNTLAQYGYYYTNGYKPNGACGYTVTGLANNYMLLTRLENSSASPNSCSSGFTGWDNNNLNYIVGSSQ